MNRRAAGMSLVELIVAMAILSVGVLGMAGAAAFAQRSFASAGAVEAGAEAAAEVIDSLLREPLPAPGARQIGRADVSWTVHNDAGISRINATVRVPDGASSHEITYHAIYSSDLSR